MKILVTGQDGFTGRYLVEDLVRRGHSVLPFEADITHADAVERAVAADAPDAVIHLAAIAFVHSDAFAGFYAVNQLGTFNLLDALARHAPGIPVLLASSANIYGNAASGFLDEDTPPNPVNHYAVSKWAMEQGAKLWADRLRLIVARPFNYTGVGQEEQYLVAKIVAHFRSRAAAIELGNLNVARDFGDVRALSDAYAGLVERGIPGTFNICTGAAHSIEDILSECRRITGHSLEVRVNPAFVRSNDVALLAGDNTRLRTALPDWQPRALNDTLAWMLVA